MVELPFNRPSETAVRYVDDTGTGSSGFTVTVNHSERTNGEPSPHDGKVAIAPSQLSTSIPLPSNT